MQLRGRRLKFTAVAVLVVMALTGFSSGRGHGRHSSRHGSSGGGGCSSSSQDHDSSSYSSSSGGSSSGGSSSVGTSSGGSTWSGSDDSYGSSSSTSTSGSSGGYQRRPTHRATSTASSGARQLQDGTATLVSCASATVPYATVEITNPNQRKAGFQARVTFFDAGGTLLLTNTSSVVTVSARGTATARVKVGKSVLASVDHCQADTEAEVRD